MHMLFICLTARAALGIGLRILVVQSQDPGHFWEWECLAPLLQGRSWVPPCLALSSLHRSPSR